jgi:hypothetical protein
MKRPKSAHINTNPKRFNTRLYPRFRKQMIDAQNRARDSLKRLGTIIRDDNLFKALASESDFYPIEGHTPLLRISTITCLVHKRTGKFLSRSKQDVGLMWDVAKIADREWGLLTGLRPRNRSPKVRIILELSLSGEQRGALSYINELLNLSRDKFLTGSTICDELVFPLNRLESIMRLALPWE